MHEAGFSEQKMINRLQATDQVFELSDSQPKYRMDEGVSESVIDRMRTINSEQRQKLLKENAPEDNIISEDPASADDEDQ